VSAGVDEAVFGERRYAFLSALIAAALPTASSLSSELRSRIRRDSSISAASFRSRDLASHAARMEIRCVNFLSKDHPRRCFLVKPLVSRLIRVVVSLYNARYEHSRCSPVRMPADNRQRRATDSHK
jgi:hypothetical protein